METEDFVFYSLSSIVWFNKIAVEFELYPKRRRRRRKKERNHENVDTKKGKIICLHKLFSFVRGKYSPANIPKGYFLI